MVGLGYVGLPLAIAAAESGIPKVGVDISEAVVSRLLVGQTPTEDVDPERIEKLAQKFLTFTIDFSAIRNASEEVTCVPAPLDENISPNSP